MKRIFGIALVLAVVATLAFGSIALADDPPDASVTVTWSMPVVPGSVTYQAISDPGPSNTENIANVQTNLTVAGTGSGSITTQTVPYVGHPYYGTYQLVRESLVASGWNSGQALDYTFNANDDVYNRDPSMGFQLDADAWGNYSVNIQSRHGDSATEAALDLNMSIPGGGAVQAVLTQGITNTNIANTWLSTSGSGTLTMVKPTSYCQYLGYTVFGDIDATGSGQFGLLGSKSSGVLDFQTVGVADATNVSTTMNDVNSLSVITSFLSSTDFEDTWQAHLVFGAGKGGYWPSGVGEWYWTGYEFAFDGVLK